MKTDVCGLEYAGSASNFGAWNLGFDRTAKKNIRGFFRILQDFLAEFADEVDCEERTGSIGSVYCAEPIIW